MEIAKDRPAYITFEVRPEENRAATMEAGHPVFKDVEYVLITPQGSKDRVERRVQDWFSKLEQDAHEGRFPREWLNAYKAAYAAWKEGQEAPVDGTALSNWPAITPSLFKICQGLHVRTVEDLAVANEETLQRMGMGGRALKQKAVEYLATANNIGKTTEAITALKVENEALKQRNASLEERLQRLEAAAEAKPAK